MRFKSTKLDSSFTYPCSKADITKAFGKDLLDHAVFGLWPEHHVEPRLRKKLKTKGRVLLSLSVQDGSDAVLLIFKVRKEDFSLDMQSKLQTTMRGPMKMWLERKISRPDTAIFGQDSLVAEWTGQQFLLHESTFPRD